jgi:hypothetical protein
MLVPTIPNNIQQSKLQMQQLRLLQCQLSAQQQLDSQM